MNPRSGFHRQPSSEPAKLEGKSLQSLKELVGWLSEDAARSKNRSVGQLDLRRIIYPRCTLNTTLGPSSQRIWYIRGSDFCTRGSWDAVCSGATSGLGRCVLQGLLSIPAEVSRTLSHYFASVVQASLPSQGAHKDVMSKTIDPSKSLLRDYYKMRPSINPSITTPHFFFLDSALTLGSCALRLTLVLLSCFTSFSSLASAPC